MTRLTIFAILLPLVILLANPFLMDYITYAQSDSFTGQLNDVDQTTIKNISRLPGLIYLAEGLLLLAFYSYYARKVFLRYAKDA